MLWQVWWQLACGYLASGAAPQTAPVHFQIQEDVLLRAELIHLSLDFWSAEHLRFPLISVGVEGTWCFRKPTIMHEQTRSEVADAPQSWQGHSAPPEQSLKYIAL